MSPNERVIELLERAQSKNEPQRLAGKRYCLTEDGSRAVPADDPEAAYLLVGEKCPVPESLADELELETRDLHQVTLLPASGLSIVADNRPKSGQNKSEQSNNAASTATAPTSKPNAEANPRGNSGARSNAQTQKRNSNAQTPPIGDKAGENVAPPATSETESANANPPANAKTETLLPEANAHAAEPNADAEANGENKEGK